MTPAIRILLLAVIASCDMEAWAQSSPRKLQQDVLPRYELVDDRRQLEEDKRDVSRYTDIEYTRNVGECAGSVGRQVGDWLAAKQLVAASRLARPPKFRVEVELRAPKPGTLIIDYIWAAAQRTATLDIQFLSNESLSAVEREKLVMGLELVTLRSQLAAAMKCG